MTTHTEPISLREFNSRISAILRNSTLTNCWIVADLSDVAVRGGHCYLELIDKDPNSGITVAKSRGIIWANNFQSIKYNFESITGQPFTSGIKVMLQVSVNFHEQFGLSLLISDINPEYTLGDMERQRREIIARLSREGIIDMNKELPMPQVAQRIAIISATGAAGYGDFMSQLDNNNLGIKFYTCLFTAKMQGKETSSSIIEALNRILCHYNLFDCVVIIRGGGATSELNSFDDYNLAANVAQFPIPIITGIGHERDNTVIDYVSHLRVKTPTAAAQWLISRAGQALDELNNISEEIVAIAHEYVAGAKEQLAFFTTSLPHIIGNRIEKGKSQLRQYSTSIPSFAHTRISTSLNNIAHYADNIPQIVERKITIASMNLQRLNESVNILSPINTLKRGYSITTINGKAASSTTALSVGDEIKTIFTDGSIISQIKSKN